jgi:hypothetical protein
MDYFAMWVKNIETSSGINWRRAVDARGECRRHTGPSTWFAAVRIEISPDSKFNVEEKLEAAILARMIEEGWRDQIILGVLDITFTHLVAPLRDFKLTILDIEFNDVESTPKAFRLAAREATKKILELYPTSSSVQT